MMRSKRFHGGAFPKTPKRFHGGAFPALPERVHGGRVARKRFHGGALPPTDALKLRPGLFWERISLPRSPPVPNTLSKQPGAQFWRTRWRQCAPVETFSGNTATVNTLRQCGKCAPVKTFGGLGECAPVETFAGSTATVRTLGQCGKCAPVKAFGGLGQCAPVKTFSGNAAIVKTLAQCGKCAPVKTFWIFRKCAPVKTFVWQYGHFRRACVRANVSTSPHSRKRFAGVPRQLGICDHVETFWHFPTDTVTGLDFTKRFHVEKNAPPWKRFAVRFWAILDKLFHGGRTAKCFDGGALAGTWKRSLTWTHFGNQPRGNIWTAPETFPRGSSTPVMRAPLCAYAEFRHVETFKTFPRGHLLKTFPPGSHQTFPRRDICDDVETFWGCAHVETFTPWKRLQNR